MRVGANSLHAVGDHRSPARCGRIDAKPDKAEKNLGRDEPGDGQGHGNQDRADDIGQDIWLTVIKKIGKLKDVRSFNVWLYRIARNKVYDGFRRKDRFVSLPEDEDIPVSGSEESGFDEEDAEKLHLALNNLKPYHREVLTLGFLEQMSYQSIADVIGCSIGTVRSRMFYAKRSLRKELEEKDRHKA